MALEVQPAPHGLVEAIQKSYRCKAVLKESVIIDYHSEQRPLWNGTVHIVRLRRRKWPNRLYALPKPGAAGGVKWVILTHGPIRFPSALDAVKSVLRKKWSKEVSPDFAVDDAN